MSLIPLSLYAYLQVSMAYIEKDTEQLNEEINTAENLEKSIQNIENKIFNDTRVVSGLSHDSFPLHRFLLFTSVRLPEDIRLYSITSENVLEKQKEKEAEAGTENANETPTETPTETKENAETTTDDSTKSTEQGEQVNQQKEIEKLEEVLSSQRIIYIRGAALSVESLGTFMTELESSTYIDKVDIQDIQKYYNGAESYKFFELTVRTK